MPQAASGGQARLVGWRFGNWVGRLRDRLKPAEYVDWADTPEVPESPYRARLSLPVEHSPAGVEVRERDVVRGELKVVYEVRCACGRRWFNPRLERVQLCPRCDRAVLLHPPE
jgi:hypothetical protein